MGGGMEWGEGWRNRRTGGRGNWNLYVKLKKKIFLKECLLLSQRTFWRLTTYCNSNFRRANALLWPLQALHSHVHTTHVHTCNYKNLQNHEKIRFLPYKNGKNKNRMKHQRDWKELEPSFSARGNAKWFSPLEKQFDSSKTLNADLPSHSTFRPVPKIIGNTCPHRSLHRNIHQPPHSCSQKDRDKTKTPTSSKDGQKQNVFFLKHFYYYYF